MTVTAERLKALLPGSTEANRLKYLPYFNRYMSQYGFTAIRKPVLLKPPAENRIRQLSTYYNLS